MAIASKKDEGGCVSLHSRGPAAESDPGSAASPPRALQMKEIIIWQHGIVLEGLREGSELRRCTFAAQVPGLPARFTARVFGLQKRSGAFKTGAEIGRVPPENYYGAVNGCGRSIFNSF